MTVRELRDAGDVATWLAAGLALRRVPAADDARVAQAITACALELPALPPAGVIADLAALLGGARLPLAGAPVPGASPAVRAAVLAYEDEVLGRLVTAARWDDVVAATARAPDLAAATALVVAGLVERCGGATAVVSAPAVRSALGAAGAEVPALVAGGRAALAAQADAVAAAYGGLARGARHARALVDERERFAIEHLASLRDRGGRMTAAHLAAAAAELGRALPRRVPARRLAAGEHATALADASTYPAGGFAAIAPGGATTGALESLVTSELAYMDDADHVDLFALRYLEGELLRYTRDDSVLHRRPHWIGLSIAPALAAARVKDPALPWQRLVLALGLVVAAARWLVAQLGDRALTVRVAVPPGELAEEGAILAVLLADEIARGAVTVVTEAAAATLAVAAAERGLVDLVFVGAGPAAAPPGVRAHVVTVAGPAPTVHPAGAPAPAADLTAEPWEAWRDAAEDLLRALV